MTKTLPRGICRLPSGSYYARVNRDGVPHRSGPHETPAAALAALDGMNSRFGPARKTRTPKFPDWPAEFARQLGERPGADLSCIYMRESGMVVIMTRNQVRHYGGHFTDLSAAMQKRDEMDAMFPIV